MIITTLLLIAAIIAGYALIRNIDIIIIILNYWKDLIFRK